MSERITETFEVKAYEVFLVLRHVGDGTYTKVGQSAGRKSYRNKDRVVQIIENRRSSFTDPRQWRVIVSYDSVSA